MKCWPGWASVASTMKWYIVTARASAVRERSLRSSPVTSSSISNVLRKPQVSSGSVAAQRAGDRAVAALDDLVHEAVEEDGVARLVDLLGGEEVLLLLARGGVDERREVVGDGVLAVEEHRVVPQRGLALELARSPRATARGRRRSRSRSPASCRAPSARRGPRRRSCPSRRSSDPLLQLARKVGRSRCDPAGGYPVDAVSLCDLRRSGGRS